MSIVIVSGALANKVGNGGGTWERMSWAIGLQRLGFDVYFIEQIAPEACVDGQGRPTAVNQSANFEWFKSNTEWFGIQNRAALVTADGEQCFGIDWDALMRAADSSILLINLSGHLTVPRLVQGISCKAFVDVDPGFTQYWHADPAVPFRLPEHDFYFTIGENIGSADCSIPTGGIRWQHVRQPVVLDNWPLNYSPRLNRFSTVASWRGAFGRVEFDGKCFGLKVHEFRKFVDTPSHSGYQFEVALDIHAGDSQDRLALERSGWRIVDPATVVGTAAAFRKYIQQSDAEFSVAQGIYVDTNSGWFSDRTVRYLASGKPALVQETGFGQNLPVGEGLLSFRTMDDVAQGVQSIATHYASHARAAREIAETYFASDRVLTTMLEGIGIPLPQGMVRS